MSAPIDEEVVVEMCRRVARDAVLNFVNTYEGGILGAEDGAHLLAMADEYIRTILDEEDA